MWETIQSWPVWSGVGTGMAWLVTVTLLLAGLIGCVLPVLPGHLLILLAAVAHRLMLGAEESGIAWWSFLILGVLIAASQVFEFFSSAAGTQWFGGTRWGAAGALIGSIIGMFFFPIGLLVGPLAGALLFEMAFAKKETKPAVISGVGSLVGTMVGMIVKIAVGAVMIFWFLVDVFFI